MLEILNTLMMCIGYFVTVLAILVSFFVWLFIKMPKGSIGKAHFAWFPTYVAIWDKNYTKHKFIWLRYYFKTDAEPKYCALDDSPIDSKAPAALKYVVSAQRRTFLY